MSFHVHHDDEESSHTGLRHGPPQPPTGMQRQPSMNTRYMKMLLDLDSVPGWHNLLVAISAWLLLAGFVIFPGTFTSIQNIDTEDESISNVERWVLKRVRNLPLLVIAGLCCGIGAVGMIAFWIRWRRNYVWLCNRIFLPGTLHSIAGLLSTLINVYTAQHKQWSITARVSAVVEGVCLGVCGLLWVVYSYWLLGGVKRNHRREFGLRDDDLTVKR